ncbi:MAG: hypothetical protein DSZ24_03980 [Thermodesulfatator sp.]|nr:MAG: hypothetical protein DSZ24_03980 [Thermodesulfatator sp.]
MNFAHPERALREFELRNLLLGVGLVGGTALATRDPRAVGSVLTGVLLSLILFQYLKRDGRWIVGQALAGVSHGKIVRNFLLKYYLRLLGVGFLLGLAFRAGLLHPVFLTLGLSVVVLQGFLVAGGALLEHILPIGSKRR